MPKNDKADEAICRTLGLLLIDGFALMSYASVIEPFRAANTLAGRELYRWRHISVDGRQIRASNGAAILADQAVGQPIACDTLFVIAGGDPVAFSDPKTFAWLRQLALSNVRLAGISGGPFLLARAGVLAGYRATIHWDHQPAFLEAFPTLAIEPGLYVIDRRRLTCAGGTAGLDLAIELIEREHGSKLAAQVSEWFIRTEPRPAGKSQRLSLRERVGVSNDRVLRVLAEMEATLEEPAELQQLAEIAGVSLRQLERLFASHMQETVSECYLRIRLEKAAELLRKTGLSVTAVGVACGFQSSSHFSRTFKARYGKTPSAERRRR
ncbi:GlxA family transcriptional regulator [Bradyrhizobium prioriisuperbiae]|uniref:GlxA family transcriptional regulator n=1 Tax=Bradyrhizobium prioriisuperbiae TaxID=2854389 RepID=UPI0028E8EDF9|nr:GlxA family transcriptional regulator [Bradyrhizobium prioritasuperba]